MNGIGGKNYRYSEEGEVYLRWAFNRSELGMGRKKGGPSGERNDFSRSEEAEMCLLSVASRNTSLTGKDGLLGGSTR